MRFWRILPGFSQSSYLYYDPIKACISYMYYFICTVANVRGGWWICLRWGEWTMQKRCDRCDLHHTVSCLISKRDTLKKKYRSDELSAWRRCCFCCSWPTELRTGSLRASSYQSTSSEHFPWNQVRISEYGDVRKCKCFEFMTKINSALSTILLQTYSCVSGNDDYFEWFRR